MIPMLLYTSVFFGVIPVSFTIVCGIFFLRKHRVLAPLALVLALYQAACVCVIVLTQFIPGPTALVLLAAVLPAVLALAGSLWTVWRTKSARERAYGIGASMLGYALTGGQIAFYITAAWGTV